MRLNDDELLDEEIFEKETKKTKKTPKAKEVKEKEEVKLEDSSTTSTETTTTIDVSEQQDKSDSLSTTVDSVEATVVDKGREQDGIYNIHASSNNGNTDNLTYVNLDYAEFPYGRDYYDIMSTKRDIFYASLRKDRKIMALLIGFIFAIAVILLVVVVSLSGKSNLSWVLWTCGGVGLAACIGMFIFYAFRRKKSNREFMKYYHEAAVMKADYIYGGTSKISCPKIAVEGKASDIDVIESHYFKVINTIDSRFRIECRYLGKEYSDCEIAIHIPVDENYSSFVYYDPKETKKLEDSSKSKNVIDIEEDKEEIEDHDVEDKEVSTSYEEVETSETTSESSSESTTDSTVTTEPTEEKKEVEQEVINTPKKVPDFSPEYGVLGKFISYNLCLNNNEGIMFLLKSKGYNPIPTNTKNYSKVTDTSILSLLNDNIDVYCTSNEFATSFITKKVAKALNDIRINQDPVLNMFITMNSSGTKVGINYIDEIMAIPIDHMPSKELLDNYRRSINDILEFLKVVQE